MHCCQLYTKQVIFSSKSYIIMTACCASCILWLDKKRILLYYVYNKWNEQILWTKESKGDSMMIINVDFNSEEAIYIQLRNQIIIGIATSQLEDGDALPSVRQLADHIGINMHTVNKAYSVLKQEGFVKLDRRKGAVIALDYDKAIAMERLSENLQIDLAEAMCKNISRQDVHELVDKIFDYYEGSATETEHEQGTE